MGHVKNSLLVLGVIIITGLASFSAKASLLIEPHLGFNLSGGGKSNGVDYSYNGAQYGLRLGGQYLGLMAGIDYNLSSYTWEQTPGGDDTFDRSEFGLFVGYNLPILVRFWGAYYFSNTAKDTNSTGRTVSGAKYEGSSVELGAGWTALPFLSLNLAYRNISLDTKPSTISGGSISNNEFVLGVSLPLTLL